MSMIPQGRHMNRRTFLRSAAAAGFAVRSVRAAGRLAGPNSQPTLAAVGIGGVGRGQIQSCIDVRFRLVALCDVDEAYARPVFEKHADARRYRDFREMFDAEGDRIDAVYISTPDHTHAIVALEALRRKKHVLCVKPLARTIEETRAMAAAARRAGVATQMTASPASQETGCRTCELIWSGTIGEVRDVHIWSDRPMWPQGMARPDGEDVPPAHFDWKLWLGPAPFRPFRDQWPGRHPAMEQIARPGGPNRRGGSGPVYHPWNFRGWHDFGTGALGDMGCHLFNTPWRALRLGHPTAVSATSTRVPAESWPLAAIVTWEFPAREGLPPVRVTWYDGGLRPPRPPELEEGRMLPADGVLYIGTQGTMLAAGGGAPRMIPEPRLQAFTPPPRTLERRSGIYGEWIEAIRGGPPASEHWPDCAAPLTELVLLGCTAVRIGGHLTWDGAAGRFTNNEAANELLKANYQNGWSLTGGSFPT